MTISLTRRVTLRELLEQAWQQIEGQAREMLKRAGEGLLEAERDRRGAQGPPRGGKGYRWGFTGRKGWGTPRGCLGEGDDARRRGGVEVWHVGARERDGL